MSERKIITFDDLKEMCVNKRCRTEIVCNKKPLFQNGENTQLCQAEICLKWNALPDAEPIIEAAEWAKDRMSLRGTDWDKLKSALEAAGEKP